MARRSAVEASVTVALERGAGVPLHLQLYEGLREAVLTGRLRAGTRLPSTRMLASDLGVSRNTVMGAFLQLLAEGYWRAG
jgi:GntR family transcriptional regulator/MocR family aminotransferase